jgi:hypothetical protein
VIFRIRIEEDTTSTQQQNKVLGSKKQMLREVRWGHFFNLPVVYLLKHFTSNTVI